MTHRSHRNIALFLAALLLLILVAPLNAQDATPEAPTVDIPVVGDITVEAGGTIIQNNGPELPDVAETETPPNPALGILLTMAASVAGLLEVLKPIITSYKEKNGWSDDIHTLVVRLVAFGAALVLIFLTPNEANVVTAWGLTLALPLVLVKIATAFVVSMGASIIWGVFRFLKLMPVLTAVMPAVAIPTVASQWVVPTTTAAPGTVTTASTGAPKP